MYIKIFFSCFIFSTECDCGFFGECKFELDRKKCNCDEGYVDDGGYCKGKFT